jgi:excisionase family DNA binding protein
LDTAWRESRWEVALAVQTSTINGLMTVQQAAQFLSVSVSTLYGWAWQRKIPFVKVGRALRFDKCDLENFVRANRFEARNDLATRGRGLA